MKGKAIKDYITSKGVNQSELARNMGITRQALSKKLASDSEDLELIRNVATFLGEPLSNFIPEASSVRVEEPFEVYGSKQKVDYKGEIRKVLNDNTTLLRIIEERNDFIIKLMDA